MPKQSEDPAEIQQEALAFRDQFKTVLLSTADEAGINDCSYAPYVCDEQGALYIFVSQLASHTKNLQANPHPGLMFIQDESECRNLFARKRLTLNAKAKLIDTDDDRYETMLNQLSEVHGNMVGMLRTLPDFQLFRLEPVKGRFVRGFGNAWEIEGLDLRVISLSRG